jgi:hypothetical protein
MTYFRRTTSGLSAAILVFLLAACGSSYEDPPVPEPTPTPTPESTAVPTPEPTDGLRGSIDLDVGNAERCDPLDLRHCLLPFPSDTFTLPDSDTDTGLHLNLAVASMIRNNAGVQVATDHINRNDGWSPGAVMTLHIPGLDLVETGVPPLTDLARSLDADSPSVLLDADTGERVPHWVELDQNVVSDDDRLVLVRPAVSLITGHRHIFALRGLKNASGGTITAGDAFGAYRDELRTNVPEMEERRDRYEAVFADLDDAGVDRDDLYLAWDFTVASSRNLTERMLKIRDDAFAWLGGAVPSFTVDSVEEPLDDRILRRIEGTFEVPHYMTMDAVPGAEFVYGEDGLPERQGMYTALFRCIVPHAAFDMGGAAVPARPSLYGHGLLGSEREVSAGNVRDMANEHNFVFCATRWLGMAEEDIGNAVSLLGDLSNMNTHADRLQQGVLAYLFLGRLMIHPDGLGSDPAFQAMGTSVIDTTELYYDGNSQGGIMGAQLIAVAQDITKAVLGVPGINYSLLLQRSVDWDTYRAIYEPAYPDPIEQALGILIMQLQWDRGEGNGYAAHMTDNPLPDTPAHRVLLHVAFGDHQVTPASAEIEARTIGAAIHRPVVADGRLPDVEPGWGLETMTYPHDGSAIIVWDSGAPTPPTVNLPPRAGEDPHADPRSNVDVRRQKAAFLAPESRVIDVCGPGPCQIPPR